MGFWQTGYAEFHDPWWGRAPGIRSEPSPRAFACAHCNQLFASVDALRSHRFECHPLRRPVLFLRGQEIGSHPVRVTRALRSADVTIDGCDHATLNGDQVAVEAIPLRLAKVSSDVCRLRLSRADVAVSFTLEFRVASENDLVGVEREFDTIARAGTLDARAIDAFIGGASRYESAMGYCDGISSYLYGVLAKEKATDSSLTYDSYARLFTKASEQLVPYDRSLAQTIASVIGFHFNHFREAAALGADTRVGQAASRCADWVAGRLAFPTEQPSPGKPVSHLDRLITDWETERIVGWIANPVPSSDRAEEIESFLRRDLAEYDRVKLRMLLGELYGAVGDVYQAGRHAKALRNVPGLERWAELMIHAFPEGDHA